MSRRAGDRLLNWGFVTALTLHGIVLAGAACLPAQVMKDELSDIRVFDADAPALMVPVELVEIPAAAEPETEPALTALVREEPRPKSPAVWKPPLPQPVVRPKPPAPERKPAVEQPRPPSTSPREPVEAVAGPAGGGGGGGPVNLGTPSANGDLQARGGETPVGSVPGSGSGSGSGVGTGEGGGSGGGTGGGAGEGTGAGTGSGAGAGTGDGAGGGFSSRVADRREPVVVFKGNLEYPSSAVADGVEGAVKLRVLVSEGGTVQKVKVVESSRDRRLDSAAVEFVRGWRYKPAVQDGEPRSVYTYAVVRFELK